MAMRPGGMGDGRESAHLGRPGSTRKTALPPVPLVSLPSQLLTLAVAQLQDWAALLTQEHGCDYGMFSPGQKVVSA